MGAPSPCVECYSTDTNLYRGDDGHFRKECNDCGHVGGPYVSGYGQDDDQPSGQAALGDFDSRPATSPASTRRRSGNAERAHQRSDQQ